MLETESSRTMMPLSSKRPISFWFVHFPSSAQARVNNSKTTYHEVSKSYPKAIIPPEKVSAISKEKWWREFYDKASYPDLTLTNLCRKIPLATKAAPVHAVVWKSETPVPTSQAIFTDLFVRIRKRGRFIPYPGTGWCWTRVKRSRIATHIVSVVEGWW